MHKCILSNGITSILIAVGVGLTRYAVTTDVAVTESTQLQFYLSMGCASSSTSCFGECEIPCDII